MSSVPSVYSHAYTLTRNTGFSWEYLRCVKCHLNSVQFHRRVRQKSGLLIDKIEQWAENPVDRTLMYSYGCVHFDDPTAHICRCNTWVRSHLSGIENLRHECFIFAFVISCASGNFWPEGLEKQNLYNFM